MRQPTKTKPTTPRRPISATTTAPTDSGDLAALLAAVFQHPDLPPQLREWMLDIFGEFDSKRVKYRYAATSTGILKQYCRAEVVREILQHGGRQPLASQ